MRDGAPPASRKRRAPVAGQALRLELDRAPEAPPLYRQIRDGVRAAVLSGMLSPGTRLPPEREMAAMLGVNRTTTMRAYQELVADGVIEARPGRGTVVCRPPRQDGAPSGLYDRSVWPGGTQASWLLELPALGRGNLGPDPTLLRDISALSGRRDLISFAAGSPAPDLIPLAALQQAVARGLERMGAMGLAYGPVEGLDALRLALAERLAQRGVAVAPDEILILSGATQGLALAAHALVEPGDEIVVEAPTYVGMLQTFSVAGARLIGVPVDEHGLRVDLLPPILTRRRVRLILVQPTLHNPTGVTLSPARRERLLSLARRFGVPILEDEIYADLWNDGAAPPPLKALDRDGLVLHLSSCSKTVAPGLRVGWLAASAPVVARLALAKQFSDLNTTNLGQLTLAEFLGSGDYDRHLARLRFAYAERRALMLDGLRAAERYLQVTPGAPGGFYLWCRLLGGSHARLLSTAAVREGVAVLAGEAFYPPGLGQDGRDHIRLSFSGTTPPEIVTGLSRLRSALERLPGSLDAAEGADHRLRPVV